MIAKRKMDARFEFSVLDYTIRGMYEGHLRSLTSVGGAFGDSFRSWLSFKDFDIIAHFGICLDVLVDLIASERSQSRVLILRI